MRKRLELEQTNRPCGEIMRWQDDGYLWLDPPYQRGDVWGERRRVNFIRSMLMGIPIPSIIINSRIDWSDEDLRIVVIDGKQRITSVLKFITNELMIPSNWLYGAGASFDRDSSSGLVGWSDIDKVTKRKFLNIPLAFSEGKLESLELEKEVFDLVNFGGIPQGEKDVY